MNKKTLTLIGDLNHLYDNLFNEWNTKKGNDITDYQNKLKLIKVISKHIIEKDRGFLKSNLNYKECGYYITQNINKPFNIINKNIQNILFK